MPRQYEDYKRTGGLATGPSGSIWMQPTSATHIHFDAAKSSHIPAYAPTGEHGSTIIDVGRGVSVRLSGHAHLTAEGPSDSDAQELVRELTGLGYNVRVVRRVR